ncbi:MAG: DsbA family protein [Nanoarchaeota archaeon]
MAKAKKTTAKKTAVKKAAPKKAAAPKKTAPKNAVKKAAPKKAAAAKAPKTKATKVAKKPVPKKTETKTTVSKTNKEKVSLVTIIGGIVLVVLVLFAIAMLVKYMSANDVGIDSDTDVLNLNSSVVNLVIIEDPECTECRVDEFATMFKAEIIPELEYQKLSYESELGKQVVEKTDAKFVPIFLFTDNINTTANWTLLSPYFTEIETLGQTFYMLNPEIVQAKSFIGEVPVLEGTVVLGNEDAEVTVYEFTDYECPYCAIAEGNEEMVEQFQQRYPGYIAPIPKVYENYVETDKIRYVFYNYPIPQLHPLAEYAHLAALCANEQGMWKEYSDKLFGDRQTWAALTTLDTRKDQFKEYADDLGLETAQFDACLDEKKYASQIEKEVELGKSLGVAGTPGFFVNQVFISGAQDYQTFESLIESELSQE